MPNIPNQNKTPKIISVFNNKGGVGKTTYLYHLAHLLAESGKKVLCVDCDSQCNLTAYFLPGLTSTDENNALKKLWIRIFLSMMLFLGFLAVKV